MYNKQFTHWNIHKYLRKQDVPSMAEHIANHEERHQASPEVVPFYGRLVDASQVKRSLKRHSRRQKQQNLESNDILEMSFAERPSMLASSSAATSDALAMVSADQVRSHIEQIFPDDVLRIVPTKGNCITHPLGYQQDLSIGELGALSVAILQTDYHLEQMFARAASLVAQAPQQPAQHPGLLEVGAQFGSYDPLYLGHTALRRQLQHLKSALQIASNSYARMSTAGDPTPSRTTDQSARVMSRDFYGRFWLGLSFEKKVLANQNFADSAEKLVSTACHTASRILSQDHFHFIPWACFVACYPPQSPTLAELVNEARAQCLHKFSDKSESVSTQCAEQVHSMSYILFNSEFRRDIALVLLRLIISEFRRKTSAVYDHQFDLLNRLFEALETQSSDMAQIEEVLQKWANASLSIAQNIRFDYDRRCREVTS